MKTGITDRGFRYILAEKYQNEEGVYTRLLQESESSAIGDREEDMSNPGSSFLWVGNDHHLSRAEVREMVDAMNAWLETGKLPIDQQEVNDE